MDRPWQASWAIDISARYVVLAQMTPEEKARLLALVNSSLSADATSTKDPLFGLMADEPELVDDVVQAAHAARHGPRNSTTARVMRSRWTRSSGS